VLTTIRCRIAAKDTPVTIGIRRSDLHRILLAAEVRATPLADKVIENLPKGSRSAYDRFEAGESRVRRAGLPAQRGTTRSSLCRASARVHAGRGCLRVGRSRSGGAGQLGCTSCRVCIGPALACGGSRSQIIQFGIDYSSPVRAGSSSATASPSLSRNEPRFQAGTPTYHRFQSFRRPE
jgi:hypothetical protein